MASAFTLGGAVLTLGTHPIAERRNSSVLIALTGENTDTMGPGDVCSVPRDYETERLVARFAVVRRHRFTGPIAQPG